MEKLISLLLILILFSPLNLGAQSKDIGEYVPPVPEESLTLTQGYIEETSKSWYPVVRFVLGLGALGISAWGLGTMAGGIGQEDFSKTFHDGLSLVLVGTSIGAMGIALGDGFFMPSQIDTTGLK